MSDYKPGPVLPPDSSSHDPEFSSSQEESRQETARSKPLWREYAEAIVIALVLALTIRVFLVQAFKIPSGSMIPSLQIGDHILVNKLAYGLQIPQDCEFEASLLPVTCYSSSMLFEFEKPERGDIIVFRYPEDEHKDFIKRIVGLPGDTIHIHKKIVYINGEPFRDEPFTQRVDPGVIDGRINPRDNLDPITVPRTLILSWATTETKAWTVVFGDTCKSTNQRPGFSRLLVLVWSGFVDGMGSMESNRKND